MSSEHPARPLPRHPSVLRSRLIWQWPLLVWIGMALLAVWLYQRGGDYMRINGMVEAITESVSPLETGRIVQVHVIPGDQVAAGQALAQLDTSLIDEEIAAIEEELGEKRADVERQFLIARERLLEEMRGYTLDRAEAQAELAAYRSELERLEPLAGSGMVDAMDLAGLRARVAALAEKGNHFTRFIGHLEEQLARLEESAQSALAFFSIEEADAGRPSELSLLRRTREDLTLRASQAGVVTTIHCEPGEVLRAGDPVLDIITERPRRILAFMNEMDVRPVSVGDVVEVQPAIGGERFQAKVVSLSPNFIALEDRASPIPSRLIRGRQLELVPLVEQTLTPGASMIILLPMRSRFESFFGSWEK